MTSGATPPLPPPPVAPFVPFVAAWAVDPPDQPGAFRRAYQIWRRTLVPAIVLTAILGGIPTLVQQALARPTTGTTAFSIWLHTGHFPSDFTRGPQPSQHPLSFPISLATIVLTPLLYVTLLRLMMGSAVGEQLDMRSALSFGWSRIGKAIGVGLCAILIVCGLTVPLAAAFVALVNAHLWKVGVAVLVVGLCLALATVSLSMAVLLGEERTGLEATGRSWHLAWRAPALVIAGLGCALVVDLGARIGARSLITHAVAGTPGRFVAAVVGLGLTSIGTTLIGAFIASAYLQVRARDEAEASAESLAHALTSGDPFR